ncbi:rRNA-processing protein FCF1 homolog isoform X1 [Manis pentadactyla]|uniref:rRNA-processing protein FCF1 homolog isoform X1 n=1 Tax=Manis pentadactyla TaxID=143292 RepID=UPI0018740B7A|nr:rRNA-processing protein FCF1 homolog isoform X1 [Manis pentadactyla]
MGKQKKARKYATMKRMLSLRDQRLKEKDRLKPKKKEKKDPSALKEREVPQHPSCLFFQYNTQLGPPYHILVDTNFINFSIKAKLDLVQSMMDCLYAKCIPCITDCVMAEIEKLGQKYRVALRIAKDPRFERLPCTHKGTYADDCLVQRVTQEFGSSPPCLLVAQKYFSVTVKSFRGLSHSTSVTLWPRLTETLSEESGRSLEFPSCTYLTIGTTLSECQMIMEPLGSNS